MTGTVVQIGIVISMGLNPTPTYYPNPAPHEIAHYLDSLVAGGLDRVVVDFTDTRLTITRSSRTSARRGGKVFASYSNGVHCNYTELTVPQMRDMILHTSVEHTTPQLARGVER